MPVMEGTPPKENKDQTMVHIDEKFLQDHLKDVRSEMSWRRELEFRLMQFLLVFYPIVGTAMVSLFQSKVSPRAFTITASGAVILIIVASIFVTDRIIREHKAYAKLGKQVQGIWQYFGLFKPGAYLTDETIVPLELHNEKTGYGQGPGHIKTLGLIWLVTFAMILVLLALAILKT